MHVVYLKVVKLFVGSIAFIKYCVSVLLLVLATLYLQFHYLDCLSHLKI